MTKDFANSLSGHFSWIFQRPLLRAKQVVSIGLITMCQVAALCASGWRSAPRFSPSIVASISWVTRGKSTILFVGAKRRHLRLMLKITSFWL
jgi:hypothetical protein